ncbi:MAG: phytoene/squalene synthase family protein [Flavobacteriales bacterium]|nr:phytoene/squalene synthase family protein [Flavobacteriales bacterium]MCB9168479.1 phytoene/squalene synthase family protein [Flavobacteriales bacterium]
MRTQRDTLVTTPDVVDRPSQVPPLHAVDPAVATYRALYDRAADRCSRVITHTYSTSFSWAIRCLHRDLRRPIHAIYGFVRLADEIVDTFAGSAQAGMLTRFQEETHRAIAEGISIHPVLHSFQWAVRTYGIERALIDRFLHSMGMDLTERQYDDDRFAEYILGSAEVVGLMCLRVFCARDDARYERLVPPAMRLGAAFQKINFLRDLRHDHIALGRSYFPGIDLSRFDEDVKRRLEADIAEDLRAGSAGIAELPRSARLGVTLACRYFRAVLRKIARTPADTIMQRRIRISNGHKLLILAGAVLFPWNGRS